MILYNKEHADSGYFTHTKTIFPEIEHKNTCLLMIFFTPGWICYTCTSINEALKLSEEHLYKAAADQKIGLVNWN